MAEHDDPDRTQEHGDGNSSKIESHIENGTPPKERLVADAALTYEERLVIVRSDGGVKDVLVGRYSGEMVSIGVDGKECRYRVQVITTEGQRGNNEDCVLAIPDGENGILLMNDDGMGGEQNGERASKDPIEAINSCQDKSDLDSLMDVARQAVTVGKSTADLVRIRGDEIEGRHVGDSRVVLLNAGGVVMGPLTADHSFVAESLALGTELDPDTHDRRHVITRSLGSKHSEADAIKTKIGIADSLIMFTDGVVDANGYYLKSDQLRAVAGRSPEAAFDFVASLLPKTGDNISMIVVTRLT